MNRIAHFGTFADPIEAPPTLRLDVSIVIESRLRAAVDFDTYPMAVTDSRELRCLANDLGAPIRVGANVVMPKMM